MLNIYVNDTNEDNTIYDIDAWFDSVYEPEWIEAPITRAMISDIDKSKVVAPRIIDSPFLGYVDPTHLSGGVKMLICFMFDRGHDWIYDLTNCGDNCAKWVQRISAHHDLTVFLNYLMLFTDTEPLEIRIMETGKIAHTVKEYMQYYLEIG